VLDGGLQMGFIERQATGLETVNKCFV